jgi:hypothetical protein
VLSTTTSNDEKKQRQKKYANNTCIQACFSYVTLIKQQGLFLRTFGFVLFVVVCCLLFFCCCSQNEIFTSKLATTSSFTMFMFLNILLTSYWAQMESIWKFFFASISFILFFLFLNTWKWTVWIFLSFIIAGFKALFGLYQTIRITCTLGLLVFIKFYINCFKFVKSIIHTFDKKGTYYWRKKLRHANTYKEWFECAEQVDATECNHEWKESDDNLLNNSKLVLTTEQLASFRDSNDFKKIIFELPGMVKRNHLGIDDHEVHDRCLTGTKKSIENFRGELMNCFEYIKNLNEDLFSKQQKINFFQKMSRNLGQSALCLSGGGSLSMYHMGVIRALLESGSYQHIRVISGASGGSIATAMCAMMNEELLLKHVLVDSVRYPSFLSFSVCLSFSVIIELVCVTQLLNCSV